MKLEDLIIWPDTWIQKFLRNIDVEDSVILMKCHNQLKDRFFPNVKMTTRIWLQEEIDKQPQVSSERLQEVTARSEEIMKKLKDNGECP